jgi:hypothetical protein
MSETKNYDPDDPREVNTVKELAEYALRLRDDFYLHEVEWQNGTVPDCLEAMAAWLSISETLPLLDVKSMTPVQFCAHLLHVAKIYE